MPADSQPEILVDFNGKSLKVDKQNDAKPIVEALKKHPKMTTFRMSGNTVGVDGALAIGERLSEHKELSRCLFSDMFTGMVLICSLTF